MMKRHLSWLQSAVLGTACFLALPAAAAERSATFHIENLDNACPTCPIAVKTAMERVDGVASVAIDLHNKTATVTYEEALASVDMIAKAAADIGYPAKVVK